MKWTIAVAGLILVCAASASAQRLEVKIIDRQDKEDAYDYAAVYNNVAVGKSFKVHGATFTLRRSMELTLSRQSRKPSALSIPLSPRERFATSAAPTGMPGRS